MRRMSKGDWSRLYSAFRKTARYFKLADDERAFAWTRAQHDPIGALRCYAAIARSI